MLSAVDKTQNGKAEQRKVVRSKNMGGKGSGRPKIYKTEEERRQAILESKRKYNKAHREERIAYMKQWYKKKKENKNG